MEEAIYVRYYATNSSVIELNEIEEELKDLNIKLIRKDLTGEMYQSLFEFIDLAFVGFSFELIKEMILSGSYDIFKSVVKRAWKAASSAQNRTPFTIAIKGIPSSEGYDNIKIRIKGQKLSSRQKDRVIDKMFELANNIAEGHSELRRGKYYDASSAHLLEYDDEEDCLHEIDIDKIIESHRSKEKD